MWEPQRLTTLWVSTACYRESFTFFYRNWIKLSKKRYSTPCTLSYYFYLGETASYLRKLIILDWSVLRSLSSVFTSASPQFLTTSFPSSVWVVSLFFLFPRYLIDQGKQQNFISLLRVLLRIVNNNCVISYKHKIKTCVLLYTFV
jgi:hypothetical protein